MLLFLLIMVNSTITGTIIEWKRERRWSDIIWPFRLDPLKAVTAWNYTYPDDVIDVKPASLLEISHQKSKKGDGEKKTLDIISGCTKASTFVGFVHMLKVEKSDTSKSSSATIEKIKRSVEIDVWRQSFSGRIDNLSFKFLQERDTRNRLQNLLQTAFTLDLLKKWGWLYC